MLLALLLAVGAVNFAWQLGSSSYFVDEARAVIAGSGPIGHLLHTVATTEITPPAYFAGLHGWIHGLGLRPSEWQARLPSVIAGVALVAAVWWLASLVSERRVTRGLAAGLVAVSPFVLRYAQLAQGYIFVALAVTVAIAAVIQSERSADRRDSWLAGGLLAAMVALTLHYTATIAIAPLCTWVAINPRSGRRWRLAFPIACLLVDAALIPLALRQHDAFPTRGGTAPFAGVTWANIADMIELPFNGRVTPLKWLGVAAVLGAGAVLVLRAREVFAARAPASLPRRLVVLVAVGEPLVLLLLSALGGRSFWGHLMLTRYAAVAAPGVIVLIALACEAAPLPVGGALAAGAIVAALAGSLDSHRRSAFYDDTRGVAAYIRTHERAGDAVLAPHSSNDDLPLGYYGLAPVWLGDRGTAGLIASRAHRLWVIGLLSSSHTPTAAQLLTILRRGHRPAGYAPVSARVFPGLTPLGVILDVPASR